jgi:hypothetical protein
LINFRQGNVKLVFLKEFKPIILDFAKQSTIEEISIFSNSSHLEWRAGLSDTILKGIHPGTIPAV